MAQVTLYGGGVREFQVQVDPDRLIAHGLTLTDVLDAARQATGVRGAGFQEDDNQRSVVRVEAQVRSADELGEALVTDLGRRPRSGSATWPAWSRPRSRSSATRPSTACPA